MRILVTRVLIISYWEENCQGKLKYLKITSEHEENKIISDCMYNQMQKYILNFTFKSPIAYHIYAQQDSLLLLNYKIIRLKKTTLIQYQIFTLYTYDHIFLWNRIYTPEGGFIKIIPYSLYLKLVELSVIVLMTDNRPRSVYMP